MDSPQQLAKRLVAILSVVALAGVWNAQQPVRSAAAAPAQFICYGEHLGVCACFAPGSDPDYVHQAALQLPGALENGYSAAARWTQTATDGSVPNTIPITLTYSFVPDVNTGVDETTNTLHATLDAQFGSTAAWKALFREMFDDWSEHSGITFVEEPNDDGASWPGSAGQLGVRGDIRIVAQPIDGGFGVLAFNYFPNSGDMTLDSAENWANSANNFRFLRNVLMHELGHGLGLNHVNPRDNTKLMEALLNTNFDGPQDDDIRGVNSKYGDALEFNDTLGNATALDPFVDGLVVDNLSLHSNSDVDFYRMTSASNEVIEIVAAPVGASYSVGPDPGTGTAINTKAVNGLRLEVYTNDGLTLLGTASAFSGQDATVAAVPIGADGIRIKVFTDGSTVDVQRYQLNFGLGDATPRTLTFTTNSGSVSISLAPAANDGETSISTPDSVVYDPATTVVMTAPEINGSGVAFLRWVVNETPQPIGERTHALIVGSNTSLIAVYAEAVLAVDVDATLEIATGESATISPAVTGGAPPYSYEWQPGGATSATLNISPTSTTDYTLTVRDSAFDSVTAFTRVEVTAPPNLVVTANASTILAGGSAKLQSFITGGAAPYTYSWSPAEFVDDPTSSVVTVRPTSDTVFTLTIVDALGREASATTAITVTGGGSTEPADDNTGTDNTGTGGDDGTVSGQGVDNDGTNDANNQPIEGVDGNLVPTVPPSPCGFGVVSATALASLALTGMRRRRR